MSAVRPAPVPMMAEPLEGRRLFAGSPMPHGHFGPHDGGYGGGYDGGGWNTPTGWPVVDAGMMRIVVSTASTTALSNSAGAAVRAAAGEADAGGSGNVINNSPGATASNGTRIAISTTRPSAARPKLAEADADKAVLADATATTASATASATAASDAGAAADEPTFGPFTIAATPVAATPVAVGAAKSAAGSSFDVLNGRAADSASRWQDRQVAARTSRDQSANEQAIDETLPAELAAANLAVEQASILPMVPQGGLFGLWQRLAVATAGATLLAANWIVRRRRQQGPFRVITRQ